MNNEQYSRAWAEISLEALSHNYRALRAMLEPGCRFLGVVKANAYGHGAVPVARRLVELGCEMLAVACLDEAARLRRAGLEAPILILGLTPPELAGQVVELGLTQTVDGPELAQALSRAALERGQRVRIHIKLDTGMGRLGIPAADPARAAEQAARLCALPGLEAEGIYTHFANADGDEAFTMTQFTRFLDTVDRLEKNHGLTFAIRHCAASAAALKYPCTHLDMVRPGIALYGHYPHPSCVGLDGPGLVPVMALRARVSRVRELSAGTPISYGSTRVLDRDSRVAVLPVGYGDGLCRRLSDRMEVAVDGGQAPVLGRICMDMCMADVTDLPQVEAGSTATFFDRDLPLERLSDRLDTISYELLCDVGHRVVRVYRG